MYFTPFSCITEVSILIYTSRLLTIFHSLKINSFIFSQRKISIFIHELDHEISREKIIQLICQMTTVQTDTILNIFLSLSLCFFLSCSLFSCSLSLSFPFSFPIFIFIHTQYLGRSKMHDLRKLVDEGQEKIIFFLVIIRVQFNNTKATNYSNTKTINYTGMVWLSVFLKIHMLKSHPQCDGIKTWGLCRVIDLWRFHPQGLIPLYRSLVECVCIFLNNQTHRRYLQGGIGPHSM